MTVPPAYGGAPVVANSLTEHDTGVLWHDGKPIFRKTISFGALLDTNVKSVAHGITGVDQWIGFKGITGAGGGAVFPIPHADGPAPAAALKIWADDTNINVATGVDWSASTPTYIVIEWTKD